MMTEMLHTAFDAVPTMLAAAPAADPAAPVETRAPSAIFTFVLSFTLVCLAIAMLTTGWRLLKGPTLGDRVISLDLLAHFIVGAIAVYAMQTGRSEIVSVAIVMALILFVGTVAFALYMEKGERRA